MSEEFLIEIAVYVIFFIGLFCGVFFTLLALKIHKLLQQKKHERNH